MSNNRTTSYTLEFKKESAKLAISSEQSINKTAKELGVSSSALHGWVKKYSPRNINTEQTSNFELQSEVKNLKKELSRVKQERDILKKAAAYFAGEIL